METGEGSSALIVFEATGAPGWDDLVSASPDAVEPEEA
jgi:hypothetical protein